ncbi:hypothetical protein J3R83DRAFT_2491 [Lanmaoa asiatica]|nr:hypothetical protein J3R83DRAFT_2491 [Lanmaoa asiatica]
MVRKRQTGRRLHKSIDAQLIRHLQAAMVAFVTDIIHRAIVWREREVRLKQRSRAWRHGDQITIGAVKHAVEAIGGRYHSHRGYFKSLGAFHDLSSEPSSAPADASEELNCASIYASVDPDVEEADRSAEPPGLSCHRDVYAPLIQPPSAWGMGALTCLTRTYELEATRTRRGTSAEIIEEEGLMSDETDEEALEVELEEEDEADARDMELAVRQEEDLWKIID